MNTLPGYTVLTVCPVTKGCGAKKLFKSDATGEIFTLDKAISVFNKHECKVSRGGGEKPEVTYLGKWYNKRTGNTRFVGPERLPRSVKRAPADDRSRKDDWEWQGMFTSGLDWKAVKE